MAEQTDSAIDTFIASLDVTADTFETHLVLAKLLRKRGETDRAIKIHQNMLVHPQLTKAQSQQVQYELALDLAKVGLLDRAESLLKNLIETTNHFHVKAFETLLEIYQDQKDWRHGLEILDQLSGSRFSKTYDYWAPIKAHFLCELAECSFSACHYDEARTLLKKALVCDKKSVRASLILGRLDIQTGHLRRGITQLQTILEQNPDYLSVAIPFLSEAYGRLGEPKKYRQFLSGVYKVNPQPIIIMTLMTLIEAIEGKVAAIDFLSAEMVKRSFEQGIYTLLEHYIIEMEAPNKERLVGLKDCLQRVMPHSSPYQCHQCGFESEQLYWFVSQL